MPVTVLLSYWLTAYAVAFGSSPVPGTKEILQVTLNERKRKIFFLLYPNLGHSLAIFSETHLTLFHEQGTGLPQNHLVILTVMPPLGWPQKGGLRCRDWRICVSNYEYFSQKWNSIYNKIRVMAFLYNQLNRS